MHVLLCKVELIHTGIGAENIFCPSRVRGYSAFGSPSWYISKFVCVGEGGRTEVGKKGKIYGRYKYEKILSPSILVTKLCSRMKAYENHYRCNDGSLARMVSYDCGVASILSAEGSLFGEVLSQIHYMDVLKHIRALDYRKVATCIALMECNWVRHGMDGIDKRT